MPLAVIRFTEEPEPELLEEFAESVKLGIREYLSRQLRRPGGRLAESIKSYVYGKQIVVESDVPYAVPVDRGTQSSKVMWHLIYRVVPIKLEGGRTIFRKVTLNSILRGKWRMKPRQGMDFVGKGVALARSRSSLRARLSFIVEKP